MRLCTRREALSWRGLDRRPSATSYRSLSTARWKHCSGISTSTSSARSGSGYRKVGAFYGCSCAMDSIRMRKDELFSMACGRTWPARASAASTRVSRSHRAMVIRFFNIFYPTDVPPFTDDGLLAKAREENAIPKIFYSNGSYEYWGRVASLIHTTPDGKQDAPPAPATRIYFFAGTEHGPGRWPPERHGTRNRMNPAEYRYLMRALLVDMQAWLKDDTAPPVSVYPRIDKGQLVAVHNVNYPKIPGLRLPLHKREAYRLDFSTEPPKADTPYISLVPQVDRNGIDEGGIRLPEVAVPLATYLGWNLRSPAIGAPDEMSTLEGSWIPFAGTRAEREADHDPRESIEERYPSKRDYLDRVSNAASELVHDRFMLAGDIALARDHAAREWDYVLTLN